MISLEIKHILGFMFLRVLPGARQNWRKNKKDLNCLQSYKTTQLSWGSVILKWGVEKDKGTKEKEKFEETSKTKKTEIQTRNTPM